MKTINADKFNSCQFFFFFIHFFDVTHFMLFYFITYCIYGVFSRFVSMNETNSNSGFSFFLSRNAWNLFLPYGNSGWSVNWHEVAGTFSPRFWTNTTNKYWLHQKMCWKPNIGSMKWLFTCEGNQLFYLHWHILVYFSLKANIFSKTKKLFVQGIKIKIIIGQRFLSGWGAIFKQKAWVLFFFFFSTAKK